MVVLVAIQAIAEGLAIFAGPQVKPWLMLLQKRLSCYNKSYPSFPKLFLPSTAAAGSGLLEGIEYLIDMTREKRQVPLV